MSVADELKKLADLKVAGVLTQQEFDAQKRALLATSGAGQADPTEVGAYRLLGRIGQGGMGSVFRGRHRSAAIADRQGGDVAIKVMHPRFARDEHFQQRFEREASLGLKLDHPGIVKVHDLVVDAGTLALVMEWVEGRSLASLIGNELGPIPWPRAWPMFQQLLDAVEHAHGRGVIHRDLKPDNVMVTPDARLQVLDFGIAKEAGSGGGTASGVGMGTVDYMAPEQHTDARGVDRRADVYALGMTLYEMLAGRLPWAGGLDAVGVLHAKLEGEMPPPTDWYPDIPADAVEAVMSALAPDPADRTDDVAALRADLARVDSRVLPEPPPPIGPGPVAASPVTPRPVRPRTPRRWPLLVLGAIGVALAVTLALTLGPGGSNDPPTSVAPDPVAAPITDSGAEILEVRPDEDAPGQVQIGHRDLGDRPLSIAVDGVEVEASLIGSEETLAWQPLYMVVDATHNFPELLDKIKRNVDGLATRELEAGSRLVVVSDQTGSTVEVRDLDTVEEVVKPLLQSWVAVGSGPGRSPSPISPLLGRRLSNVPMANARPWALVYSSLCVGPEDEPPASLTGFDGPIRFLVWDIEIDTQCLVRREYWLAALRERREIEVFNLHDVEQARATQDSMKGRGGVDDRISTFDGVPYRGGVLRLSVSAPGVETFQVTWTEDMLPWEWQAWAKEQERRCALAPHGAARLGLLLLLPWLVARRRPRRP